MISVVMPCSLDHVYFIPFSVASIEKSEVSICQKIFVADGFYPNSELRLYLGNLGWEVLVNTKTHSPGAAKNLGLRSVNSEIQYVAIQDADDLSHPKRFSESLRVLEDANVSMVGSQAILFRIRRNGKLRTYGYRRFGKQPGISGSNGAISMVYASMMFKRQILNDIGFFREDIQRGEDFHFIDSVAKANLKIVNLPNVFYFYQHKLFDDFQTYSQDQSQKGRPYFVMIRYFAHLSLRCINSWSRISARREFVTFFSEIKQDAKAVRLIEYVE